MSLTRSGILIAAGTRRIGTRAGVFILQQALQGVAA